MATGYGSDGSRSQGFTDENGDGHDDYSYETLEEMQARFAAKSLAYESDRQRAEQARRETGQGNNGGYHQTNSQGDILGQIGWSDENNDGVDDSTGKTYDQLVDSAYADADGFRDANGDGLDDSTGYDRDRWIQQTTGAYGDSSTSRTGSRADEWADANGDGVHDYTDESRQSFDARTSNYTGTRRRREESAAQQAATQASQQKWDADAAAYESSGQRQRDQDAGLPNRYAARNRPASQPDGAQAGGGGSSEGGNYGQGTYGDGGSRLTGDEGWDHVLRSIGGDKSAEMYADLMRRQQQAEQFENLRQDYQPTVNDLSVNYGQERDMGAQDSENHWSTDAQRDALRAMQDIYQSDGGLTTADRSRQALARMQTGTVMRGQREADMGALQARGMGSSGAVAASMMGAQASGANSLAMGDAQMNIAAQQRALQAMQGAGQLGTQARSATDAFNMWNSGRRQGIEGRNLGYRNQSQESRAAARDHVYGYNKYITEGKTQWSPNRQENLEDAESGATQGWLDRGLNAAGSLI